MDLVLDSKVNIVTKLCGLVIFIMAFWLAMHRDTYLPFLSPAAFPPSLIKDVKDESANKNVHTVIDVDAPDGTKIAFWGALPSNTVQPTPQIAYDNYSNAGVATVMNKQASISFLCPAKYNVPWGATLNRHIHYRVINANGMMSSVKTVYVEC
jgi:hypothetical protein